MQLRDGTTIFSASDLTGFAECEHLTQLELARLRGEIHLAVTEDEQVELLRAKGLEHERAYLERLKAEGRAVVEIAEAPDAPARTIEAMRAGPDVIYQAAFDHDGWMGYADFLFRIDVPSALGDFSYEPADTKLARHAKPAYLLQLCFYAEQIARVQEREAEHLHVVLGDGGTKTFRRADFDAYYRMLRTRFLDAVAGAPDTYPWPVRHCEVCRWRETCEARRDRDDHLTLVAGATKLQVRRLNAAGIDTMQALAAAPAPLQVPRISESTAHKLLMQARLQAEQRRTGLHRYELLSFDGPSRGLAGLPRPSPGDVFFDMEGYPFFQIGGPGLEYLFGITTSEGGYRAWWGHSRPDEKRAFEGLIDFLIERHRRHPDMHVFHYASYEVSAIRRLMGMHAIREDEVDHLLRSRVFVDLYQVVRQSLRISQPSYSIKKVEPFYMDARETDVTGGGESVAAYERWIRTRDEAILEDIRRYNEDDCVSTLKLRDWLLERRDEAAALFGEPPATVVAPDEPEREVKPDVAEALALAERLTQDLPEDPAADSPDEHGVRLLSHLLDYHRREDRPVWWAFFDRQKRSVEELLDDAECIADLVHDGASPERVKQSLRYRMTFPPQETKMRAGAGVVDAQTGAGAGTLESLDVAGGSLVLKRGPKPQTEPLPVVVGPGGPIGTEVIRRALRRFATDVAERGVDAAGRYRAARDLLLARPPRVRGVVPGQSLMADDEDAGECLPRIVAGLEESALFVQGPPGTGKTFHAAGAICALIDGGAKVGVTSNSHEAIANVLDWVEKRAIERKMTLTGMKVGGSPYPGRFIVPGSNDETEGKIDELDLLAGTAWLFSREAFDGRLDYLFIDEAGQISIADAIAMATAARNVVVIGDPAQLAQVAQGTHPDGAGRSVLEHLLGDEHTLPRDRGVFLGETWRMHPDICAFISETMYEGRLHPHEHNARQDIPGVGTGLRFLPVPHEGNRQSSEEEAAVIAERIEDLVGREWIDRKGNRRTIGPGDILVVAPYNAQVRLLRERLPDGIAVGTVDKFQGQEAAVAFFSMATSSGRELPRTLEFLFSLNRLNVAISRAQCLAYLVASPDLLRVPCRSIEQMRMVNALCRAVELATP